MTDKFRIDSNSPNQPIRREETESTESSEKVWQKETKKVVQMEGLVENQDSLERKEDVPPLSNKSISVEKEYSEEEIELVSKYAKTGNLGKLTQCEFGLLEKAFFIKDSVFGNTPLLWAIANAKNPTAQWIIETHPSCINEKSDVFGNYPIHLVIQKGYEKEDAGSQRDCGTVDNHDLLNSLIKSGANVNIQDKHGDTPLHIAFARRDFKAVELLLQAGADRHIMNNKGQKPEELSSLSYPDAVQFLKDKGGSLNTTFTLKQELFN